MAPRMPGKVEPWISAAYMSSDAKVPMFAGRKPFMATPAAYGENRAVRDLGRGYPARRMKSQASAVSVVCTVCRASPATM